MEDFSGQGQTFQSPPKLYLYVFSHTTFYDSKWVQLMCNDTNKVDDPTYLKQENKTKLEKA